MTKRWLYLVLTCVFLLSGSQASAAFSPAMDEFNSAYQKGESLSLDVKAQLKSWKALSKDSLPAVSELLQDANMHLDFSKQSENLRLDHLGKTIFSLQQFKNQEKSGLYLPLSGLGFESVSGADPVDLLPGKSEAVNLLLSALQIDLHSFADLPQTAVLLMAPYGEMQQRRTDIKLVGTSKNLMQYKLTADQWQILWPYVLEKLNSLLPAELPQVRDALELLRFEKPVTVKRYLDDAGAAMGWGVNANVLFSQGDERKLSLTLGHRAEEAFSLTLKAPAARGKNNLQLDLSYAIETKGPNALLRYETRLGSQNYLLKGEAAFKNDLTESTEHLRGTLWMEEKQGSEKASRLTLKPDLHLSGGRAEGTLQALHERGGKPELDVNFSLALFKGGLIEMVRPDKIYFLDTEPELAKAAISGVMLPLLRDILFLVPLPQRKLLLHDMGRTLRTQGELLPAIIERMPDYLVIEDTMKEVFP
ncbi:MAG: hypothetical protein GX858_05515 [Clostridiales bacterium]|nr:hypothetical protein [Clostridiales bacterium]